MIKCIHKNISVTDSRTPDSFKSDGTLYLAKTDYPMIAQRRRKCVDCGHYFVTVELPRKYIESTEECLKKVKDLIRLLKK